MFKRWQLPASSWSVIDQGVVSLGTFLVNIILARQLSPHEYGLFALLFSVFFILQTVNGSLVLYPLSVRGGAADMADRTRLIAAGLTIVLISALPLGIVLVLVSSIFL